MEFNQLRAFKRCERKAMLLDNLLTMSPRTDKATDEDCQEMYDRFNASCAKVLDDETMPDSIKAAVSRMKVKVDNNVIQSQAVVQLQIV